MKPKTAIIILIVMVIISGLFIVYLADTMKFKKSYKETILKQEKIGDKYIDEKYKL